MRKFSHIFISIALALSLGACGKSINPVSGKTDRGLMSEEQEIASGRQYHQEILKEYTPYNNPALQAYVTSIGQKLAAQSHRPNLPWTFTVVDSPEINAFAVQGGFIYITRGLMAYLDSEAELAGVVGHEIGHVTARHGAKGERDQQAAGLLTGLATILGAVYGGEQGASAANQVVGGIAQTGVLLPHSRDHELEADRLGAEYLNRTGANPGIMLEVLDVLKYQEVFAMDQARAAGKQVQPRDNYLSTHPSNEQRLAQIRSVVQQYAVKPVDPGRDRYLRAIDGITFGDSVEQGIVRGNAFYHAPLGFMLQTPNGWQIQNGAQQLTMVAPDGQAAVILGPAGTMGNHDQAIKNILKPASGRVERVTINGLQATNFVGATAQGQQIEATVVTHNGSDYLMVPMAKTAQARDANRLGTRAVIDSFRPMNSNDAARARPYTLRTTPANRGFRDLAGALPAEIPNREGQLRLLNQAYPQGEPQPGQLVKIIQ